MAAGGGSGGHVTPVVAVLSELHRLSDEPFSVRFVCDKAFEAQARQIMAQAPLPVDISVIQAGKLRRYHHFRWYNYLEHPSIIVKNLIDGTKILTGIIQSLWLMWRERPDVVFAKGGYVCLPVGWAARLLRIPLVIHDSDARPGLTNRLLARFSDRIATGYPLENYTYDAYRSRYVGVPVRSDYQPVSADDMRSARERLGLPLDRPLILSFGGGLGSKVINDAVISAAENTAAYFVVIAGKKHHQSAIDATAGADNIRVYDFVTTEMPDLLRAADIVVTRASATSLQELAALKKPIIAVPARQLGDQARNAAVYHQAQAAIVLSDDDLESGALTTQLVALMNDSDRRVQLAERLHAFSRPDAARQVALMLLETRRKS